MEQYRKLVDLRNWKTVSLPIPPIPHIRPLIFTRNGALKPRVINDIPTGCIKFFLTLAGMVGFEPTMLARQINSLLP